MMSRRSHQAEGAVSLERFARNIERGTGRAQSVFIDPGVSWRVGVERHRRGANPFQMLARMGAQERVFASRRRLPPFRFRVALLQ